MAATRTVSAPSRKKAAVAKKKPATKKKVSVAGNYNAWKQFEGKQYTGMKIGRSHKWNYDAGVWRETKITPDLWEISYDVIKRRAGHAPEGSGVPVGTGYHWYILANQQVDKINADDYTTKMSGFKFKLAHKRAGKNKWSASFSNQRKRMISFLEDMITQLKSAAVPLEFSYKDTAYEGEAIPVMETCKEGDCVEWDVYLNDESKGIIRRMKSGWKMDGVTDKGLIKAIAAVLASE
ncbi:hypothetical protein [Chitinophaga qingshengii]|nr:hypothetical protein [Chitinophaga qingshengii]